MLTIWKYELDFVSERALTLPRASRVLSVAEQRGGIALYAMVDPGESQVDTYKVSVAGTGLPVPEEAAFGRFLGTVNLHGGALMFHVFIKQVQ